jgi:hypothetical protein
MDSEHPSGVSHKKVVLPHYFHGLCSKGLVEFPSLASPYVVLYKVKETRSLNYTESVHIPSLKNDIVIVNTDTAFSDKCV